MTGCVGGCGILLVVRKDSLSIVQAAAGSQYFIPVSGSNSSFHSTVVSRLVTAIACK